MLYMTNDYKNNDPLILLSDIKDRLRDNHINIDTVLECSIRKLIYDKIGAYYELLAFSYHGDPIHVRSKNNYEDLAVYNEVIDFFQINCIEYTDDWSRDRTERDICVLPSAYMNEKDMVEFGKMGSVKDRDNFLWLEKFKKEKQIC